MVGENLPGLGTEPGAGGGEVEADGPGGAVVGKDCVEAVAEVREGLGECLEACEDDHAGEVQRVAAVVKASFEGSGFLAAEGKGGGIQGEGAGTAGGGWGGLAAVGAGGSWCADGLEEEVAEPDGGEVEARVGHGGGGYLEGAGEAGFLRGHAGQRLVFCW